MGQEVLDMTRNRICLEYEARLVTIFSSHAGALFLYRFKINTNKLEYKNLVVFLNDSNSVDHSHWFIFRFTIT